MQKKRLILIIFLGVVIGIIAFYQAPVVTEVTNIQISEIDEVYLYHNDNEYCLTKEEIDRFLKVFQNMKLKHDISHNKDGGYGAQIILTNGKTIDINVFSNDIIINGKCYRSDKDYCDEILNFVRSFE